MDPQKRFAEIGWTVQPNGCWDWNGRIDSRGYGDFWDGERHVKAHRFALAGGEPLPQPRVLACHSCDNRKCVNPSHVRWGSHQDNSSDMVRRGRAKTGRKRALSAEQIAYLQANYSPVSRGQRHPEGKLSMLKLAEMFGVSEPTIHRAVHGTVRARPHREREWQRRVG